MCSYPHGDRGPSVGYRSHMDALNSDKRFTVRECSHSSLNYREFESADIFWFYSLPFDMDRYAFIKSGFPDRKIVVGPNVFLEKGELGPSSDFEMWATHSLKCDLYCNVADYYLKHVNSFFNFKNPFVLPYCTGTNFKDETAPIAGRPVDILIYRKARRSDPENDRVFLEIRNGLKNRHPSLNVDFIEYGKYDRELFLSLCDKSKICLWLSAEDYCSLAQLECYSRGTPILGTPWNLTIPLHKYCHVPNLQSFGPWIQWGEITDDVIDYIAKMSANAHLMEGLPRFYLKKRHSHSSYCDLVWEKINGL
jgi:hypothetical protein